MIATNIKSEEKEDKIFFFCLISLSLSRSFAFFTYLFKEKENKTRDPFTKPKVSNFKLITIN